MSRAELDTLGDDTVVISGISGRFPSSDNVQQLQDKLLDNKDCIADDSTGWDIDSDQIPKRVGKISGLSKFDRLFFGVHLKLTEVMDPMFRIMMECSYEAIVDAGVNPRDLRGSKTAVFMGSSFSESEKVMFYEKLEQNGFGLTGCSRAMLPNRVSFSFGLNGPSINVDSACCSSGDALLEAYRAIKEGICDAAIIGGAALAIHPHLSLQLSQLGVLSPDGVQKCFDANANGYTRSETVAAIFLQRASHAKRVYAEVVHGKNRHVPSELRNNMMFPVADHQAKLMEETLREAGLRPTDVTYVEADGLALKVADAEEATAIDRVYNKGRQKPLLIGSVKSNVGHASSANTVNSVIKVITAMETGTIPANLHYKTPPRDVEPLAKGRLKVVSENTPWEGPYAAVNTTSFTGGVTHILLKRYKKEKKIDIGTENGVPRLVLVSGRTEEAVKTILKDLQRRRVDVEYIQMLSDVFAKETLSHLFRGYSVLPSAGLPVANITEVKDVPSEKKEIWYVFSGMGSQWVGMGESLMKLPVFAEAVKKCDAVLKPYGIDIVRILTEKDPTMYDNIVHSFVGIATVQIGLVDVLTQVGLKPDMIIGHSVGELGCAYADGCFTAEEMVLSALSRGLASTETKLVKGSMAAVGLGFDDIEPLCPPDIDVACHNGPNSATISGPADSMKKFVADLQAKGIFAKEVPCSNIAYHSRYISPAGSKLMEYLQKVITNPKPRSKRWVSSSVPRAEWGSLKARLSSAEYHTNNLLSPVLFAETSKLIPANAITVEIAPHGLLQAILKRSLPQECINVALTKRGAADNVQTLLIALGKLHNVGISIDSSKLYPRVPYPVGRNTPSISSLVKWSHENDWYVNYYRKVAQVIEGEKAFDIDLGDTNSQFLENHRIHGTTVIPCMLYLTLALEILQTLKEDEGSSVVFEEIRVHKKVVPLSADDVTRLTVMVQKGTGRFEVTSDVGLLATGFIRLTQTPEQECIGAYQFTDKLNDALTDEDIYTELRLRGYEYVEPFRSVRKVSLNRQNGMVEWKDNWTTFLDGLLQMFVFTDDTRQVEVPLTIRKIVINMGKHTECVQTQREVPVHVDKESNIISTPAVEIQGINCVTVVPTSSNESISLQAPAPVSSKHLATSWYAGQLYVGDVSSISWFAGPTFQNNRNVVKVEYAALSQHDLLVSRGSSIGRTINDERFQFRTFGLEYSGKSSKNTPVMGICGNGTLTSHLVPDAEYTWPVPAVWTEEEAATIPLSYAVAYAALFLKGELKKTDKVLVHDGWSEFGQAIINIALNEGCTVFTTYNTDQEKKFIRYRYPKIPEHRICHYPGSAFRDDVLMETKGQGVDVVTIDSNNFKEIEGSLSCARQNAKVIVIGDLEATVHDSVGMEMFLREVSLYSVIPQKVANADANVKRVLAALIKDGIESGAVKPLSRKVYERQSLKEAFVEGIAKNVQDKIVVRVQPNNANDKAEVIPRVYCSPTNVYLIIEGQSDFTLELVEWLIVRGARKIVIASESSKKRRYQNFRVSTWKNYGVTVVIREDVNLSRKQDLKSLLEAATGLGQVDGIFDLRRTQSGAIKSQDFFSVTKSLDEESKVACPKLRLFVVCAALPNGDNNWQSGLTREKQTDDLMKKRLTSGLPGVMIVCSSSKNGTADVKCLLRFDECLLSNVSSVAVLRNISLQKGQALKHKQDTSNQVANVEESEHAKFKASLYKQDKYIQDRFGNLVI